MLQIIKIVLPVVVAFFIGIICKKRGFINEEGDRQIKKILEEIIIPIIILNSMLSSNFNIISVVNILTILTAMLLVYFLANCFKRFYLKDYQKYFPEMMVTWEGGTLGFSLCSLMFGSFGLSTMVIFDIGCCISLFLFFLPIIKIKDGKKGKLSDILKLLFSIKAFIAMILGVILGASGVGRFILDNKVLSIIYHGIVDIIISPTNFLIMLTIGYGLNINKKMLKPVLTTCFFRLLFMGIGFVYSVFIVFKFMEFDRRVLCILAIAFSLPQSFSIPIFTDAGNKEYLSTTLSFMTIITILLFVLISSLNIIL